MIDFYKKKPHIRCPVCEKCLEEQRNREEAYYTYVEEDIDPNDNSIVGRFANRFGVKRLVRVRK